MVIGERRVVGVFLAFSWRVFSSIAAVMMVRFDGAGRC